MRENVDCEIPAYRANDIELELCSISTTHVHHICVPVHLRYQVPHLCKRNSKSQLVEMNIPSIFLFKRSKYIFRIKQILCNVRNV